MKRPDGIVIEPYRPEHLAGMAALRDHYRADSSVPGTAIYAWELAENPCGRPEGVVALDGDQVVAMVTAVIKKLFVGGAGRLVAETQDAYTHPDYHRRGLYSSLNRDIVARLAGRGIDLVYNTPNDNVFPILIRRLDHAHPFNFRVLARPIHAGRLAAGLVGPPWLGRALGGAAGLAWKLVDPLIQGGSPPGMTLTPIHRFPAEMDAFFAKAAEGYKVLLARDHRYLNWRYCEAPREYGIYLALQDGAPVGYVVLKFTAGETLTRAYIVDLFGYNRADIQQGILSGTLKILKEAGADLVLIWLNPGSPFFRPLLRMGFFPTRREKTLTLYSGRGVPPELMTPSNWHLVAGDTDNF